MNAGTKTAVLAVMLAALAVPVTAQTTNGENIGHRILFKLDEVDGPSLLTVFPGSFEALGYELETGNDGQSAGRVSAVKLLKNADYASPLLLQRALESAPIATAEIRWYTGFDTSLVHLFTVQLTNVRIVSVKNMRLSAVEPAFEQLDTLQELTLTFDSITWTSVDSNAPSQPTYSYTVGGTP